MEDIDCWEEKFENCIYSDKLLNKLAELNKLVKNPVDLWEVKKACYYARKYHGDQMRQSGEPYYSHPIEVAYQFAEYTAKYKPIFFTDTLLQTAILHDVIEDTILTENIITNIFNEKVASGVEGLTRIKLHGKITSAELVNLLIQQKNIAVLFIKLFDRLHNMQTLTAKTPEKAKKIIEETTLIFITLSAYLGHLQLEKELYNLCIQASITFNILLPQNHFSKWFWDRNNPLFFPSFQSDANQNNSLLLLAP